MFPNNDSDSAMRQTKERFKYFQHLRHLLACSFLETRLNDSPSLLILKKNHKQETIPTRSDAVIFVKFVTPFAEIGGWVLLSMCLPVRLVKCNSEVVKGSLL
jgi:hypothetical protein